jgi:hypothetical protein
VDQAPPLLALRLDGRDFALEPHRLFVLGTGAVCDLRLGHDGVAACHAVIELLEGVPQVTACDGQIVNVNGLTTIAARLAVGDTLRIGAASIRVVRDQGQAELLPEPRLVAAARAAAPRPAAATLVAPTSGRGGSTAPDDGSPTFTDLMARELRRTPWLLLSLALHALLLLVLWWFLPPRDGGSRDPVAVGFTGLDVPGPLDAMRTSPDAPIVVAEPAQETPLLEPLPPATPLPERIGEPPRESAPALGRAFPGSDSIVRRDDGSERGESGRDGNDVLQAGGIGGGTNAFRGTVAQLRRHGLDIVFVFDSTGSMGPTIEATKNHIAQMLEVLRALVPDARFGLVTFRDRGPGEHYTVRTLPLDQDFWRACNWMQGVTASGGGDRPEAVGEGLAAAFGQPWRKGARRVVVLAGDAPPHAATEPKLQRAVQSFARGQGSFLHTVVTSDGGAPQPDVQAAFAQLAARGGGLCVRADQQDRLLQHILSLAFGREYAADVAAVYRTVVERHSTTATWALDLARRGGPALEAALAKDPVPAPLVHALLRQQHRATTVQLCGLLGRDSFPRHGRHAVAFVLQRLLNLDGPPIDPESGEPLPGREVSRLQELARRRLGD